MKVNFLIALLFFCLSCSNNSSTKNTVSSDHEAEGVRSMYQQSKDSLISLLPKMKAHNLDCSADYWRIVRRGKASIPLLIESLTDTTMEVYNKCKGGKLNVGEVCYFALQDIGDFPALMVTSIQFDVYEPNGCWNFYHYLFDNKNKNRYQKSASAFYNANEYVFEKYDWQQLDACRKHYRIKGRLRLVEKPATFQSNDSVSYFILSTGEEEKPDTVLKKLEP